MIGTLIFIGSCLSITFWTVKIRFQLLPKVKKSTWGRDPYEIARCPSMAARPMKEIMETIDADIAAEPTSGEMLNSMWNNPDMLIMSLREMKKNKNPSLKERLMTHAMRYSAAAALKMNKQAAYSKFR